MLTICLYLFGGKNIQGHFQWSFELAFVVRDMLGLLCSLVCFYACAHSLAVLEDIDDADIIRSSFIQDNYEHFNQFILVMSIHFTLHKLRMTTLAMFWQFTIDIMNTYKCFYTNSQNIYCFGTRKRMI